MARQPCANHSRIQGTVLVAAPKSNGAGRMCRHLLDGKRCNVRVVWKTGAGTCSLNRHLVRRNLGIRGGGNLSDLAGTARALAALGHPCAGKMIDLILFNSSSRKSNLRNFHAIFPRIFLSKDPSPLLAVHTTALGINRPILLKGRCRERLEGRLRGVSTVAHTAHSARFTIPAEFLAPVEPRQGR